MFLTEAPPLRAGVNSDPETDGAELERLRQGDDRALNRLVARWERPLFAFAWRYLQNTADAREVVADAFVRLYHHRTKLRPDTKLSAWLFTTLTNLCHNRHRWRQRNPTISLDAAHGLDAAGSLAAAVAAETPSPSDELERREKMDTLAVAIERLPHELKTTLLLYHYEHMAYREIGAITDCSERGVETRLYRAKQRLRAELGDYFAETKPQ